METGLISTEVYINGGLLVLSCQVTGMDMSPIDNSGLDANMFLGFLFSRQFPIFVLTSLS